MSFISNFIKGIAIGAGAILPGISSGVLCVVFGIYEKLLDSVLGFFKNIRKNFKFSKEGRLIWTHLIILN